MANAVSAPLQLTSHTSPLPAGWHRCTDPTSGVTYYFNTATQQSQWEPPVPPAPTAQPGVQAPGAQFGMLVPGAQPGMQAPAAQPGMQEPVAQFGVQAPAAPLHSPGFAQGMSALQTPGACFLSSPSLSAPTASALPRMPPAPFQPSHHPNPSPAAPMAATGAGGDGSFSHSTACSPFPATLQTSTNPATTSGSAWMGPMASSPSMHQQSVPVQPAPRPGPSASAAATLPAATFPAAMPATASKAGMAIPATASTAGIVQQPSPVQPAQPPTTAAGLPAGWHRCSDPSSGVPYFFNTVTQQSQWEPPTGVRAVSHA